MNLPFDFTYSTALYLLLAMGVNLLYHFILGARFASLIRIIGGNISLLHSFYVFCITKFSSTITPFITGSLISKPLAAKHYADLPLNKGLLITVFEQLLDFAVLIILLPFTLAFAGSYFLNYTNNIYFIILISLFALSCILIFAFKYQSIIEFCWRLKNLLPKFLSKLGKKYHITKEDTIQTFSLIKEHFLTRSTIIRILPYTLLQVLLIPLVLQFTLEAMHLSITY